MRRTREALGLLLAALISTVGCTSSDAHLKPPKHPEEYNVPPDDLRYSKPPEFPKEVMDEDLLTKKAKDAKGDKDGQGKFGASGMGGGGAGGNGMGSPH